MAGELRGKLFKKLDRSCAARPGTIEKPRPSTTLVLSDSFLSGFWPAGGQQTTNGLGFLPGSLAPVR